MKKIILSLLLIGALSLSISITPLLAQEDIGDLINAQLDPVEDIYNPRDDVTPDTFSIAVAKIIKTVLGFLAVIFLALTVYAGFMWMTSRGNSEQIEKAKKTLVSTIIGTAIVLTAYIITSFVITQLLDATGAA